MYYLRSKRRNRLNRNRSLLVEEFEPHSYEEKMILEIAKAIGETEVRFLKYVLDQHGYPVIIDAWEELRECMKSGRKIRSYKRFLNHLIQQRVSNSP